jgi:hypothetical protein
MNKTTRSRNHPSRMVNESLKRRFTLPERVNKFTHEGESPFDKGEFSLRRMNEE